MDSSPYSILIRFIVILNLIRVPKSGQARAWPDGTAPTPMLLAVRKREGIHQHCTNTSDMHDLYPVSWSHLQRHHWEKLRVVHCLQSRTHHHYTLLLHAEHRVWIMLSWLVHARELNEQEPVSQMFTMSSWRGGDPLVRVQRSGPAGGVPVYARWTSVSNYISNKVQTKVMTSWRYSVTTIP